VSGPTVKSAQGQRLAASPEPAGGRARRRRVGWSIVQQYGLLLALVAVIVAFCLLRPRTFATWENFASILTGDAALGLVALGIMLPLVVQQYDLSVGYIATFSSLVTVGVISRHGWPVWQAIALGLAVGLICGVINGLLVAYAKLNSLVVTLGSGSALAGAALLYSGGTLISDNIPKSFLRLGQARPAGIPIAFVYTIVGCLVVWYVLSYRVLGRRLYAIGGNENAARLAGVRVPLLVFLTFVGSALLSSVGGIVQAARVGSSSADSLTSFLLPAFAAAFLSTTAIRPGHFNVWGTLIAVYLVAAGTTGMFMLGAPTYVQPLFNGAILIGAIGLFRLTMLHRAKVES
jgi:ribose transport system permease protein